MKLDRLILKKIVKIVATRCQNLRLKCTKIRFRLGWGSAQDPAGGALSDSLDFRGLLLRGGRERGK